MAGAAQTNWAGNITYSAARIHAPASVDEVRRIVTSAANVRALGSRHSFNTIADCTADLISLERMDRVVAIDAAERTVTIEGGARYGPLCEALHAAGFALHNLASLPHISVAGACATATHGSGDTNGCLATAVRAIEIVAASGDILRLERETDRERFFGAVVSLGTLGIVTQLTLAVSPTFEVRQEVAEGIPFDALESGFDAISGAGYSVSLFTDWRARTIGQAWIKRRMDDPVVQSLSGLAGSAPAPAHRHPIPAVTAENCTPQMGIAGPWHERLPHFRMGFTPSFGEELQTEYLVPRQHAWEALCAVRSLHDVISPQLQISEIRTIAADDYWMSPFYRTDCIGIHFTWLPNWAAVREILPQIEEALRPYRARPHWGKLFTMAPHHVVDLYPKLTYFRQLVHALDPTGKFRNAFVEPYLT